MFDRITLCTPRFDDGAHQSAHAISKLGETIRETSEADIKARDRVDISLAEYQRLTSGNDRLSREVERLHMIFMDFGIPADVPKRIIPGTINVSVCHNPMKFEDRYRIEFDVEQWRKM